MQLAISHYLKLFAREQMSVLENFLSIITKS